MQQSDFIAFLQENLQRLKQTSPKFWKVWTGINSVILFIAGIPTIMAWANISDLNQFLPGNAVQVILKIVAFCAGWGLFMTKLAVKDTHNIVQQGYAILSTPCADLPFTQKKEEEKVIQPTTKPDAS